MVSRERRPKRKHMLGIGTRYLLVLDTRIADQGLKNSKREKNQGHKKKVRNQGEKELNTGGGSF